MAGSLTIVGTGIRLVGQTTLEAKANIEQADKVLYLVSDPATIHWIEEANTNTESLHSFYSQEKDRLTTYLEMVEHILSFVRQQMHVCAVFYGHPGVFVLPSHEAIRRARQEGYAARMLPGVSAEDCLFADLGIDPGAVGCQSFEATDFLVHHRRFDPACSLILWQIGVVGDIGYREHYSAAGLRILIETLLPHYPLGHEAVIYEAALYAICDPRMDRVALAEVAERNVTPISTLYVPPAMAEPVDEEMMRRLGIPDSYVMTRRGAVARGLLTR
jgi:uncharacterized protein YabN with tetrapyrrole methylase and pyrophosphatase domain